MSGKEIYNCIVIGGGAAGLFFAATKNLNEHGQSREKVEAPKGLVLERTSKPGTKLLMSGGGHCNITHAGSIKDFIPCYGDAGKKIRKVLYKHNNLELMDFLETNGVPLVEEDGGRVFPKSKESRPVLNLLLEKAERNGFTIRKNSEVISIGKSPKENNTDIWEVRCSDKSFYSKNIVIATGGSSYPSTGSDGRMFEILSRDLSLEIIEPRPALCPIKVQNYPFVDLAGVSLRAGLKVGSSRKDGSLLFTHNSFSGPCAINISGNAEVGDVLRINYLYPTTYEEVFDRIQKAIKGSKASLSNMIAEVFDLPKKFCRIMESRCGGSTKKLAKLLTDDEFIIKDTGDFKSAMVTRGGVSLEEIHLSSMELKKHKGIFVIGEALNVDGETGGYNLQFAYSSARLASDGLEL